MASNLQFLFRSTVDFLVGRQPEKSEEPVSLRSRKQAAWVRADAFLQSYADESDEPEPEPEDIERALRAFEQYVQYNPDGKSDSVSNPAIRQASVFSVSHLQLTY